VTPQELHDFINHMFEQLDIYGEDLTEWEENFVESVKGQFNQRGSLSPRQREILEKIYANRTK